MMTKKDFIAVAKVLSDAQDLAATAGEFNLLNSVIAALASGFAEDNPNFDMDRFLSACGIARL